MNILLTHSPSDLANYYGPRALAALQAVGEVRLRSFEGPWSIDALAQAAQGCQLIVSHRSTAAPAELLALLPDLVAFSRCAVDIRNIDVEAASQLGILVTQASPGFVTSVTEWIVGAMVDVSRNITNAVLDYRSGRTPVAVMGRELRGATLGIIGLGRIGQNLADVALAMGMRVMAYDPQPWPAKPGVQSVGFDGLLTLADYVVCLAVATPETENLIDAKALARMKRDAFFINASRGNLVDEPALLAALDAGHLAGCALDVGRAPDQMPSLALARHPRVLATPHIGGLTLPAMEHQSMETAQQAADLAAGRVPQGAVNATQALRAQQFLTAQKARG